MCNFEHITCKTADEYIQTLSLSNMRWWEDNQCNWIFRGQSDINQKLKPTLYREEDNTPFYKKIFNTIHSELVLGVPDMQSTIQNIVQRRSLNIDYQQRLNEIIKARFVEIEMVSRFILLCNDIGFDIPSIRLFMQQRGEITSTEFFYYQLEKLLDSFIRSVPVMQGEFFDFDFPDVVALARHHGISTRFLDWTTEPLIAAFFSTGDNLRSDTLGVWALNTKYISDSHTYGQIKRHKDLKHSGLEFLHKQRGLFTEMWGMEGYYFKQGEWPCLEKYLLETCKKNPGEPYKQSEYLKRVDLKREEVSKVISKLKRMGYSKSRLMPTYDNVAQEVLETISINTTKEDGGISGGIFKKFINKLFKLQ